MYTYTLYILAYCNICALFTAEAQVKVLRKELGEQKERLTKERSSEREERQKEKIAKEAAEQELYRIKANLWKGSLSFRVCLLPCQLYF